MSQEYTGALAIVLVTVLRLFGIELASDMATSLAVGAVALWVAIRRYKKGDITIVGSRRSD